MKPITNLEILKTKLEIAEKLNRVYKEDLNGLIESQATMINKIEMSENYISILKSQINKEYLNP